MPERKIDPEGIAETEHNTNPTSKNSNFIRQIVEEDLASGKNGQRVVTRFPPEPNGYLHIGHAKSICLNFGIARDYKGKCNLRFDDTNPEKEETEYISSIMEDVRWLGFEWDNLFYASNYFEQLYQYAIHLIKSGDAYVCSLSAEETRAYRGTLVEPGKNSPYRDRSVEENLALFEGMRAGKYKEGEHVLRLKIDMASPNLNMRDPAIYRIRFADHHQTGDRWCIYPLYDYTHCISDALEGITHSLCSLEFEDHRPLYDWVLDHLPVPCHPQQIEFARLNLPHTVMSKRKLMQLVQGGHVNGWDDPRMPTISGLRRRGFTPQSIRNFCEKIGVSKALSVVDCELLYFCLREDLNQTAERRMAVLKPLKLVITNYPEGKTEELPAENNPNDPSAGGRNLMFSRTLYIEQDDFMENPSKKYFRLAPGAEVRLKHAYYITCREVIKNQAGEIVELRCTYDPETKGGTSLDGRKVKGTIHWVSAQHAISAEVRLYDQLFTQANPEDQPEGKTFLDVLNPNSLVVLKDCRLEASLAETALGVTYQFLRNGYFCSDRESTSEHLIFNRAVDLKDSWAKEQLKS